MTEKEQAFVDKWAKTEANGKTRYVVLITVIFTAIFPLITYLIEVIWPSLEEGYNTNELIKNLLVGAALGLFLSFRNWRANQKKCEILKGEN